MMTEKTTETEAPKEPSQEQAQGPSFSLQRVYLKDVSLEMPQAPFIFLEQEAPSLEISLNVGGQRLAESVFEVTVRATITAKIEEKTVYLIETTQAGIFEIAHYADEQIDPILGIVCPSILFPYLRANVADLLNRTSLPPLHLADVNFQALYEQNAQAAAEETKQ